MGLVDLDGNTVPSLSPTPPEQDTGRCGNQHPQHTHWRCDGRRGHTGQHFYDPEGHGDVKWEDPQPSGDTDEALHEIESALIRVADEIDDYEEDMFDVAREAIQAKLHAVQVLVGRALYAASGDTGSEERELLERWEVVDVAPNGDVYSRDGRVLPLGVEPLPGDFIEVYRVPPAATPDEAERGEDVVDALIAAAERVCSKYGEDWTEWADLRDAIAAARLRASHPSGEGETEECPKVVTVRKEWDSGDMHPVQVLCGLPRGHAGSCASLSPPGPDDKRTELAQNIVDCVADYVTRVEDGRVAIRYGATRAVERLIKKWEKLS